MNTSVVLKSTALPVIPTATALNRNRPVATSIQKASLRPPPRRGIFTGGVMSGVISVVRRTERNGIRRP